MGADGKPREFHIERALDVTVTDIPKIPYGDVGVIKKYSYSTERSIANCEFFRAKSLQLNGETELTTTNGFLSVLVLDGNLSLEYENNIVNAKKGDIIYIPSHFSIKISGMENLILSEGVR